MYDLREAGSVIDSGWSKVGGWILAILGALAFVNNLKLVISPDPLVQKSTLALAMTAFLGLVLLIAGIFLVRGSQKR